MLSASDQEEISQSYQSAQLLIKNLRTLLGVMTRSWRILFWT